MFQKYKRNIYSQNGEDGIILEILKRLKLNSKNKWCCEFGAWDGIHGSNTFNLVKNLNYNAVYIEGEKKKYKELNLNSVIDIKYIRDEKLKKFLFTFRDNKKNKTFALRPDLSLMSLIEFSKQNINKKSRIYYSGEVYRKNQKINSQVGFEIYNSNNISDETEIIKNSAKIFEKQITKKGNINIPIFVGKKKAKVGKALLDFYPDVNILISDDGLQHYELARDFEIAVVDGDIANFFVVSAKNGSNVGLYLVDASSEGVAVTEQSTLDPSRSHASVTFDNTPCTELKSDWSDVLNLLDRAAVLFSFEQLGGAEACMDMAKEYAMGRYAFGRSIASFQAIKHKLADMFIAVELARSNCYYGAWALSTDAPELPTAAATARVSASQAYHECSKENIQTHGGMGFTWEFDCHLYYRRCRQLAANIGSQAVWKDKLISSLERANQI